MLRGMAAVQLFVTCLGDLLFPDAVRDAESLLRGAGFEVEVPEGQVCCGQPAFNSGHRGAARRVAKTFVRAFSRGSPVVVPSGSCATMAARFLPELVGCEPFDVWELSAFLDAQGVETPRLNEGRRVAYHDSCHMLRELRIADPPRRLLERSGAEVVALARPDLCCGFGGTFSVRQPEVSVAMADDKLSGAAGVGAEALVTADPGCLMHLRGRTERTDGGPPVVHLATALARGVGDVAAGRTGPAGAAETGPTRADGGGRGQAQPEAARVDEGGRA
jgi:L-lactate dehydrogenase complex protein LldE